MQYDLTIGIVTYNTDKDELLKIIDCISKTKLNYKLYISDNSEKNYLEEVIKNINNDRIEYNFNNSNNGFGHGHNLIINKIKNKSKYHLILNADIQFEENTLDKLFQFMEKNEEVGIVGPKIMGFDNELVHSCRLLPTPLNLIVRRFIPIKSIVEKLDYDYEMRWYNYKDKIEVSIASGCFIFTRTEELVNVGGFDERYFMYMEDYDLCRKIGKNYKIVYNPDITIYHEHGKGSYKTKKLRNYHIDSAIKYFNKWGWIFDRERIIKNKEIKRKILGEKNKYE